MLFGHTGLTLEVETEEFGLSFLNCCRVWMDETQIDFELHNCRLEVYANLDEQLGRMIPEPVSPSTITT